MRKTVNGPDGRFTYDCNGNMLARLENCVSYTQSWNQEPHLQTITFSYDGDGNLIKKNANGSGGHTTYYLWPH